MLFCNISESTSTLHIDASYAALCVRKPNVSAPRLQRVPEFKRGDIFRRCAMELPPRRFSGRGKWPTCLKGWQPDLGGNGVSCPGKLWLAPADYALDAAWMRVVGATLTWEALGMHASTARPYTKLRGTCCGSCQAWFTCGGATRNGTEIKCEPRLHLSAYGVSWLRAAWWCVDVCKANTAARRRSWHFS